MRASLNNGKLEDSCNIAALGHRCVPKRSLRTPCSGRVLAKKVTRNVVCAAMDLGSPLMLSGPARVRKDVTGTSLALFCRHLARCLPLRYSTVLYILRVEHRRRFKPLCFCSSYPPRCNHITVHIIGLIVEHHLGLDAARFQKTRRRLVFVAGDVTLCGQISISPTPSILYSDNYHNCSGVCFQAQVTDIVQAH